MKIFVLSIFAALLVQSCGNRSTENQNKNSDESINVSDLDIGSRVQAVPLSNKMIHPDYFIWGASVVKGIEGKYHMFYARWPRERGYYSWVTDSEIAYAIADKPDGPYTFVNVALPKRGEPNWDGTTTHNPNILLKDGKYYLYYMGTTHNKFIEKTVLLDEDWWKYRNNQRIGVAVADNPAGPWKRFEKPVLGVSNDPKAYDALVTSNPAAAYNKDKNEFLLVYKCVEKSEKTFKGGKVRFMVATSKSPTGPFVKKSEPIFEMKGTDKIHMVAEDPYIWYQDGKYHAVVRDVVGFYTGDEGALAHLESNDGENWLKAKHPLVLPSRFKWADGDLSEGKAERPQMLFNKNGLPIYLYGAAGITLDGVDRAHTFNVFIPLKNNADD